MKLWSKEALFLGGFYSILDILFSAFYLNFVSDILFLLFIVFVVMLCFNKTPRFIPHFFKQYPKFSFYMCYIGWVPYAVIILFALISCCFAVLQFDVSLYQNLLVSLTFLWLLGLLFSCVAAYFKWKKLVQK